MIEELVQNEFEDPVQLTEKAAQMIKSTCDNDAGFIKLQSEGKIPDYAVRVSVLGGGCAGFQYDLRLAYELDQEKLKNDFQSEQYGVKVYVPMLAAPHLEGTVIDFVMGLSGAGFKFKNPQSKLTCGCGMSFG